MANPINRGNAARNFVSFLWILRPIFWGKISKLLFVIQMKFLNLEPPSTCNSRRRPCRAVPCRAVPCRAVPCRAASPYPQTFRNFGRFFPPVTNTAASRYPAHIPADTDWIRQVAVEQNTVCDLSADSVSGLYADIVCRRGLGLRFPILKILPNTDNKRNTHLSVPDIFISSVHKKVTRRSFWETR